MPFAYLITRVLNGADIRRLGSRNVGALNVYNSVGKGSGLLVFALDASKGLLAIYIVRWLGAPEVIMYLAAVFVAMGHNWSVFLGFGGGKGAATVFGVSLPMLPWITLGVLFFTVAVVYLTGYVVPSVTTGFMLLDILTLASSQPGGQVALCFSYTLLVAGAHFGRAAPQVLALARRGKWRYLAHLE